VPEDPLEDVPDVPEVEVPEVEDPEVDVPEVLALEDAPAEPLAPELTALEVPLELPPTVPPTVPEAVEEAVDAVLVEWVPVETVVVLVVDPEDELPLEHPKAMHANRRARRGCWRISTGYVETGPRASARRTCGGHRIEMAGLSRM
jgi:hypothetical protein